MNKNELAQLNSIRVPEDAIYLTQLTNRKERTLLYGYTIDRETFHVYLKDNAIHRVVYEGSNPNRDSKVLIHESGPSILIYECNPGKRLYPENCDFEFCRLVLLKDGDLPFTTFTEGKEEQQFYGKCF